MQKARVQRLNHGDGARWLKIKNPNYTQAVGRWRKVSRHGFACSACSSCKAS
jgi:hypothetical protein